MELKLPSALLCVLIKEYQANLTICFLYCICQLRLTMMTYMIVAAQWTRESLFDLHF